MFHCNGWCFPWTLSIVAGTHVCLRAVRAAPIFDAIANHKVTHLCGAPIVMSTLLNAPASREEAAAAYGRVRHRRGAAAGGGAGGDEGGRLQRHPCLWPHRDLRPGQRQRLARRMGRAARPPSRRRRRRARACAIRCSRRSTCSIRKRWQPVPRDGETLGEVMFRGNVVMKGYLKNKALDRGGLRRRLVSFRRSRRHSSRRLHPAQGPLQGHHHFRRREHFLDRGRGRALQAPGGAAAVAVVAKPDDKWGETPCAFVELKPGAQRHGRRADRLVPLRTSPPTNARATSCSPKFRRPRPASCKNSSCGTWRRGFEK